MKGNTEAENVFKMSASVLRMAPNAMCAGDRSAELHLKHLLQKVAHMKSSCVHLLSDIIKASNAPCVLGGRDREKLVSKCNNAEQCRPLNRV